MKTKRNLNHTISLLILCIIMVVVGEISCTGQKTDQKVFDAYELRINGQADSAIILLEKITADNPNNAGAWFELTRATIHTGKSNPAEFEKLFMNSLDYINKAIKHDPENAYYHSYKGSIETLQFYVALQSGDEKVGELLAKLEETYLSVFKLDPTYYENKITLVEFFGGLPPEMGGDLEKAEKYAKELEVADLISGAKATEILMPEDADYEKFWKEVVEKNPENADAYQALGRIYLFLGNFDQASEYYSKAIQLDQSKNDLYLDLGRYHLMTAMQNPAIIDSVAPLVEEQFNKFINSKPEPYNPMKAWVYSKLAMINQRTENQKAAESYMTKANDLDPYHSRAFGKPGRALYSPPDVVVHEQGYYLSPF